MTDLFIGQARVETMRKDINRLRTAIRTEYDIIAAEEALDRCERWFDCLTPNPPDKPVDVASCIDTAMNRLSGMHDYASRIAWDQVLREELEGAFSALATENERLRGHLATIHTVTATADGLSPDQCLSVHAMCETVLEGKADE